MPFIFKAKIYKVGINPCVEVPERITNRMTAVKGYIPVKGWINQHEFYQTLCPVKNAPYRLYVNGPMLKGSRTKVGDTVTFKIEPGDGPLKQYNLEMPKAFKKALSENKLTAAFQSLTPSRRNEIIKYLNFLKSEEALERNIKKVIGQLKNKSSGTRVP